MDGKSQCHCFVSLVPWRVQVTIRTGTGPFSTEATHARLTYHSATESSGTVCCRDPGAQAVASALPGSGRDEV